MERKLRVENRVLNRHEQTCHEHDQFTFHTRVRITGRLVRVAFTSMLIEITGSELVLVNLHDTRCAERGEVSRVGTSHRGEVNVAFDAHLYGTCGYFRRSTSPFQVDSARHEKGFVLPRGRALPGSSGSCMRTSCAQFLW